MNEEIKELLQDFDGEICVTDLDITLNGTKVDYLILDKGKVMIWAGAHPFDHNGMNGEELLPNKKERNAIYKEVLENF